MGRTAAFLIGAICCCFSDAAFSAGIDAGSPKGAEVTSQVERKSDSYRFPVAAFGGEARSAVQMTGLTKWAAMKIESARTQDIIDGYRARLLGKGFEVVLDCAGRACGGFDFRFGADLLPPPAMQMDVGDFAQLSLKRVEPPGVISVLASNVRGVVYIQTVTVVPEDGDVSLRRPVATVEPAPVVARETDPITVPAQPAAGPQSANTPYDRLIQAGHLAISGVSFATGGAQIASGSSQALDGVAQLLKDHDDLKVAIVGHSDNQGGLNANIALSQRRAEAVMRALIKRGIPAGRLEARGIGYLSPLQSNTTEEGRALNRRVELVVR